MAGATWAWVRAESSQGLHFIMRFLINVHVTMCPAAMYFGSSQTPCASGPSTKLGPEVGSGLKCCGTRHMLHITQLRQSRWEEQLPALTTDMICVAGLILMHTLLLSLNLCYRMVVSRVGDDPEPLNRSDRARRILGALCCFFLLFGPRNPAL